MYKSDSQMSVPGTGTIDVHVRRSWEFNVYSEWQMCLCDVLIHVIVLQYQVSGIEDHTLIIL